MYLIKIKSYLKYTVCMHVYALEGTGLIYKLYVHKYTCWFHFSFLDGTVCVAPRDIFSSDKLQLLLVKIFFFSSNKFIFLQ